MHAKFVTGEPALLLKKTLVIADLHIGIEQDFRRAGLKMPSQLEQMVKRIDSLLEKTKAKKLIILGDVKHRVPGTSFQEEREIPGFFRHFRVPVEVVPGNHDDNLKGLAPGVEIHPSSGIMESKAWLCHGHAWPRDDFLKAGYLVISHSHPRVEFRDKLGKRWTEPVWVKAELEREKLENRYGKIEGELPEVIIMPAFNTFSGGVPVNREKEMLGPVMRCARMKESRLFMLDGTFLGETKNLVLGD